MIINFLIFLSEITKLGLLYLAADYGLNSTTTLIFCWLIWELAFSIILGKFSDIKGRKLMLFITVTASVIVSLLGRSRDLFVYSLLVDGILASSTLPIAFATKNDQNPTKSKRLTYAEAYQFRAIPWIVIPLAYFLLGFPEKFWDYALLISSLISFGLLFFVKDQKDQDIQKIPENKNNRIFTGIVIVSLVALFIAESSYQAMSYLVEQRENLVSLTKSYVLFGFGMGLTCTLHKFLPLTKRISLSSICGIVFFCTAIYFFIKFCAFSWEDSRSALNYTEKAMLGASSGLYIPLIYTLVCDRFKTHQQGVLCGLLEATMTIAEIISPALARVFIKLNLPSNVVFLIIGFGFFMAFYIISGTRKYFLKIARFLGGVHKINLAWTCFRMSTTHDSVKELTENLTSVDLLYGDQDLSSCELFRGGYINFGYWDKIGLKTEISSRQRVLSSKRLYAFIFDALSISHEDTVLEVGCGIGNGCIDLHKTYQPKYVIGIDASTHQIKRAEQKHRAYISKHQDGIKFVSSFAENIKIKRNSITKAYSLEALQHFTDIDAFLDCIFHILKPKGKLVISTFFFKMRPPSGFMDLFPNFAAGVDKVIQVKAFYEKLSSQGFTNIKYKTIGHNVWFGFDRWISQTNYKDTWDKNWLWAYQNDILDYYVFEATKP